jgi:hypothetical protein
VKLSGGERQRIALARAFLADAPVLILDEATSSLDSQSKALIQEATERLMLGRTSIIIAHRLSTVRMLDRILVFDHSHAIEEGTHESLITERNGTYKHLFDLQTSGLLVGAPSLFQRWLNLCSEMRFCPSPRISCDAPLHVAGFSILGEFMNRHLPSEYVVRPDNAQSQNLPSDGCHAGA